MRFFNLRFCGDKYEPLLVRHVMLRTNAGYNRSHLPIMYDILFVSQYLQTSQRRETVTLYAANLV
jgi:hypothetical protein